MRRDDLPPDYTPLSFSGSASKDGDRKLEAKLSAPVGLVTLLLLVGLVVFLLRLAG